MVGDVSRNGHIIGSVGSGKTTLARKLSSHLGIPYYELDNIVRKKVEGQDRIKRTTEERDALFHQIVEGDRWIIEGVHTGWVNRGFERADVIIFLDPPLWIRKYRIVRRFIRQKLKLEKAHYRPRWEMFHMMFHWSREFEKISKPEIFKELKNYADKVLIITDTEKFFRNKSIPS